MKVTGHALLILLAALGSRATAAGDTPYPVILSVTAVAPPGPGNEPWLIYLDGVFDPAAAKRLSELIVQKRITRASVHLNSPGGSLLAAMSVGRLLRALRFDTHVGRRNVELQRAGAGVCYSACPFAYAGGVRRFLEAGSVLGAHEAVNRVPVPDESAFQQLVAAQGTQYLGEMGVSAELLGIMRGAPHDGMRVLTRDEAVRLGLVNAVAVSAGSPGE